MNEELKDLLLSMEENRKLIIKNKCGDEEYLINEISIDDNGNIIINVCN